jgi:hypothetical protein
MTATPELNSCSLSLSFRAANNAEVLRKHFAGLWRPRIRRGQAAG